MQLLARKPTRTTSPSAAITTADAKLHLDIASDVTTWDTQIAGFVAAAAEHVFNFTGGWLPMAATHTLTYECWPCDGIDLQIRPVSSVTHVKYYDTAGTLTTWDTANYRLDNGGAMPRIVYDDSATLPLLDDRPEAVVVTFVCGAATAGDVPTPIRQAMLLLVGHWFENRGAVDRGMSGVPHAVSSLLAPYTRASYP